MTLSTKNGNGYIITTQDYKPHTLIVLHDKLLRMFCNVGGCHKACCWLRIMRQIAIPNSRRKENLEWIDHLTIPSIIIPPPTCFDLCSTRKALESNPRRFPSDSGIGSCLIPSRFSFHRQFGIVSCLIMRSQQHAS